MTIKKRDFLLNYMMFCLGTTVGRRIGDPYLMRHLAAKLADLMLVNLPHWSNYYAFFCPASPKNGKKTPFYIILHNLSSLPGTKMGTHPYFLQECSAN
jgi:hypothetical protein